MAKVLFTAVVADMRGKVAGTVFSKNAAGAFARTKVTPINRRSVAQTSSRSLFSNLSATWRTLTDAQRESWINRAKESFGTNVFGATKTISGQQLYISVNSNLTLIDYAPLETAPAGGAPIFTGEISVNVTGYTPAGGGQPSAPGGVEITTPESTGDEVFYLVSSTGPISAGINNPSGRFKRLDVVPTSDTTADYINAYAAIFGQPKTGDKIFFEFTPINSASGVAGAKIILATYAA